MKSIILFQFFFELLSNFNNFINSNDCIGKITSQYIRLYPVFTKKKDFNLIREGLFLVKKREFQIIITMIMLTRSSERIYNPSRYTGINLYNDENI